MQRSGAGGSSRTSPEATRRRGCSRTRAVRPELNFTRSTASASPAGTRARSACASTGDPRRRSSSWSSPMALCGLSDRIELEQTSSASPSSLWAGERRCGFCSWRTTSIPASASRSAASVPARPPPMMWTSRCIRGRCYTATSALASSETPRSPAGSRPRPVDRAHRHRGDRIPTASTGAAAERTSS